MDRPIREGLAAALPHLRPDAGRDHDKDAGKLVQLVGPTEDQREHLDKLRQSTVYDPAVVIGRPDAAVDDDKNARIKVLEKSLLDFHRAASSLLQRYNLCDMPEDDSRQWQQLADAILRSQPERAARPDAERDHG